MLILRTSILYILLLAVPLALHGCGSPGGDAAGVVVSGWSFTLAPDSEHTNLDPTDLSELKVSTAPTGHVVVSGATSTDFDGGGTYTGNSDGFVLVLDANGNELWRKQFRDRVEEVRSTFISGDRLVLGLHYFQRSGTSTVSGSGVAVHDLNTGTELWSYSEPQNGSNLKDVVLLSDDTLVVAGFRLGAKLWTLQSNGANSWNSAPSNVKMTVDGFFVNLALSENDALFAAFSNFRSGGFVSVGEILLGGESADFIKTSEVSLNDAEDLPNAEAASYAVTLQFAVNHAGRAALGVSEGMFGDTDDRSLDDQETVRIVITSASSNAVPTAVEKELFSGSANKDTRVSGAAFNRDDHVVVVGASVSDDSYWGNDAGFLRVYDAEGTVVHTELMPKHIWGLAIDEANRVVVAKQTRDNAKLTIEALAPQIMQPPTNQ